MNLEELALLLVAENVQQLSCKISVQRRVDEIPDDGRTCGRNTAWNEACVRAR